MRAPVRWSELEAGMPAELRTALEGERLDAPSPSQLAHIEQQVRSALVVAPAVPTVAHGALIKTTCATLALIASAAALHFATVERGAVPADRAPRPARTAPAVVAAPRATTTTTNEAARAAPVEAPVRPSGDRGVLRARKEHRAPATSAQPAQPGLAAELDLITRARAAVTTAPSTALQLLQQHEHDFRAGLFGEEREALRIEALVALYRTDEARKLAATFRRQYPGSAYQRRITRRIGGE